MDPMQIENKQDNENSNLSPLNEKKNENNTSNSKKIRTDETKDHLKQLVVRYFHQLSEGCGRPSCPNIYCASSHSFFLVNNDDIIINSDQPIDINKSTLLSKSLFLVKIKNDSALCPHFPSFVISPLSPIISIYDLNDMIKQSINENNHENRTLIRLIGNSLSDINTWDHLFGNGTPTFHNPHIDWKAYDEFNSLINHPLLNENVQNSVCNSLSTLISTLPSISIPLLRKYLLFWSSPLFTDPNYINLLKLFLFSLSSLSLNCHQVLVQWCLTLSSPRLHYLLEVLQQFATIRFLSHHLSEDIEISVKSLSILHKVNSKIISYQKKNKSFDYQSLLPLFQNEDFYLAFCEEIDYKEHFIRWQRNNNHYIHHYHPPRKLFTICQYPYVLDPACKAKFLQMETHLEMRHSIQESPSSFFSGHQSIPYLLLMIDRQNILQSALNQLVRIPPKQLKKPLRVHFVGEQGIDEGGVKKEFFQLIIEQLFDPKFGMFVSNYENNNYWFQLSPFENSDEFELVGILLGLALYNGIILDIRFPQVIYKKLRQYPISFYDIKDFSPSLFQGFVKLLEYNGDVESVFCRNFIVEYESYDQLITVELKENGKNISLTTDNRQEYVELYTHWLFFDSIQTQYQSFEKGFLSLAKSQALEWFEPPELELLICGSPVLDFEALERSARYDDGYSPNSPIIIDFWSILHEFTLDKKKQFLKFLTGSDRVPIKGLSALVITISKAGPDSDRLPSSHTCFNHLLLPEYKDKEKLRKRLLMAINYSEGFGLY